MGGGHRAPWRHRARTLYIRPTLAVYWMGIQIPANERDGNTTPDFILSIDVELLRKRFPTLARKTYLNSGSHGLLSVDVRQALEQYLDGLAGARLRLARMDPALRRRAQFASLAC